MSNEMRKKFELTRSIPADVCYNEELDAYCWKDSPGVTQPDVDNNYISFCDGFDEGLKPMRHEINRLRAEVVALKEKQYPESKNN